MRAIRQTVRVLPGGRIEITDAALEAGVEADVVVIVPEPTGDGAAAAPEPPPLPPLRSGMTFEEMEALPPLPLDQLAGSVSGPKRTVEEIDRDLRELRDE